MTHVKSPRAEGQYRCGSKGNLIMRSLEEVPLWDSVAQPFANALEFAFGCHHRKLSRVFTLNGHSYKVCCNCGSTFRYSLETMSVQQRRRLPAALRRLQMGRRGRRLLRRSARG